MKIGLLFSVEMPKCFDIRQLNVPEKNTLQFAPERFSLKMIQHREKGLLASVGMLFELTQEIENQSNNKTI
jgi:hypothetical protein